LLDLFKVAERCNAKPFEPSVCFDNHRVEIDVDHAVEILGHHVGHLRKQRERTETKVQHNQRRGEVSTGRMATHVHAHNRGARAASRSADVAIT
jgi:sRNA-binding protein